MFHKSQQVCIENNYHLSGYHPANKNTFLVDIQNMIEVEMNIKYKWQKYQIVRYAT